MTEAFEGLSPGGRMYPGLPDLPGELGSMPSLSRRMPAGMVRSQSDTINSYRSFVEVSDALSSELPEKDKIRSRARARARSTQ